jgi:hypothetical protein
MKELIFGIALFISGFLFGYLTNDNVGVKEPIDNSKKLSQEIILLQKDVMRIEARTAENLIKINYLEYWRDSVVYRPEKKPTAPKR